LICLIVSALANQEKSFQALVARINPYIRAAFQFVIVRVSAPLAFEPISYLIGLTVLLIGYTRMQLELSSLFIILYALKSCADLLHQATNEHNQILNLAPSLEQIDRLQHEASTMAQRSGGRKAAGLVQGVVYRGVHFAYPRHTEVLKDINLEIAKGQMTAIVGRSGSGKTTIIDILMGFYEPTKGSVLVDGIELKDIDIQSWRRRIGFVPQEPFLFNATLRENLLWAKTDATDDEMRQACDQAM